MTDVFISYARSSGPQAQRVQEMLRSLGYEVWRDDELPAHRRFTHVIEERLAEAKAVLVLWSHDACRSEWVQSEADRARKDGKLVQSRLDDADLPMPFDRVHCADLRQWTGEPHSREWLKIVGSIAELAGAVGDLEPPRLALPTLPDKPSIAVMPITNLSSEPGQDYLADGIVEDILAALGRYRSLYVIAAGDQLISRGRLMSPHDAARELGIRYRLEGSLRKAGARVRITLRLVESGSRAEVWTERFDDAMEDIFALQDKVAQQVAGALEAAVDDADKSRTVRLPTANASCYELFLRADTLFRISRKAEMRQSTALLDQAVELDPDYALALSQGCVNRRQLIDHEWCDAPEEERRIGLDYAERALRVAPDDVRVLAQAAAGLSGLENGTDRALLLVERALSINPSSSFAWLISGSIQLRHGDPETAAAHLETAMRLDPISSRNAAMRMYLASARFQQHRFDDALALFRTTTLRLPISYLILAALHGYLDQPGEAQSALEIFRSITSAPIEKFSRIWFPRPDYQRLLLDGLAAAQAGGPRR